MVKIKGGDKFVKYLTDIGKKVENAGTMRVGFMEGATNLQTGFSVPTEAFFSEFGNPRVGSPPRPFFRSMIASNKESWGADFANLLRGADGDFREAEEAMVQHVLVPQLKLSISEFSSPELSPVTVMIRGMKANNPALRDVKSYSVVKEARQRVEEGKTNYGASDKPLVDTGSMLASVSGDVV